MTAQLLGIRSTFTRLGDRHAPVSYRLHWDEGDRLGCYIENL